LDGRNKINAPFELPQRSGKQSDSMKRSTTGKMSRLLAVLVSPFMPGMDKIYLEFLRAAVTEGK
jgi:hypothetical protein